jgi:protease II
MAVPFLNPLAAMTNETLPLTIHEYDEWGTRDPIMRDVYLPLSTDHQRLHTPPGNPNTDAEVYDYIKSYDPYVNLSAAGVQANRRYVPRGALGPKPKGEIKNLNAHSSTT